MPYRALVVFARLNGKPMAQYTESRQPFEEVRSIVAGQGRLYEIFSLEQRREFTACAEKHGVLRHAQAALREADGF